MTHSSIWPKSRLRVDQAYCRPLLLACGIGATCNNSVAHPTEAVADIVKFASEATRLMGEVDADHVAVALQRLSDG